MDSRGSFFFLLIVFYLLLSSSSRPPLIDQDREHEREAARGQDVLRRLNASRHEDFNPQADRWLPLAGVRKNDSYAWNLLPDAQEKARHQLQSAISSAGLEPPESLVGPDADPALNFSQVLLPVYSNVTGKMRGDWVRDKQKKAHPQLNMTALALEHEYFTHEFSSNVTGDSGTFYLELLEDGAEELRLRNGQAREIRAVLAVESDDFWGNTWHIPLYGFHFPQTGGIVLSTITEKFDGLFALPHFTLSSDSYDLSHQLLLKSLSDAISQKPNRPPSLFPWSSLVGSEQIEFPAPKCEHIVYLQQHPVAINDYLADGLVIQQIEQELRYPIGAPIPSAPLVVMSAVVFSPDCGYILETKGAPDYPPSEALYLAGPKLEEFAKYSSRAVFLVCGIFVAQLTLLLRQIKEASTPSTRSRISFYTVAMMAFGDAFILVFILMELYPAVSFLLTATLSFLTFLSVSYIGMKFMMEIWAVQEPERREDRRPSPPAPAARPTSLPLPATAARPGDTGATPVILAPDQDPSDEDEAPATRAPAPTARSSRADVGAMYARFYFVLFVTLIVSIWSLIWPNRLGVLYARSLGFVYLSFWTPQIYRNIIRNCRKALRWDFMVGQSILRLAPIVYLLTVRGNVLFIRPSTTTAFIMVGWVWVQAWVLASQDILGPRFFVPRGWAPSAYDYHPILRENGGTDADLESGGGLPIGYLRADERELVSESKDHDKHRAKDKKKAVFDCAICMQEMEVPILAAAGTAGGSSVTDGASSILSRRTYMVTPCRHIFHSTCLESWMRLRLQCPICRESIPPV